MTDTFPYKNKFYNAENIWAKYKSMPQRQKFMLSNKRIVYKSTYKTYPCSSIYFMNHKEDYEDINILPDLFTEYARVRANFKGYDSLYNFYIRNMDMYINLDPKEVREKLWHEGPKEVNQFKANIAENMYKRYGAKKVLDPSMGWGDRLMGAALANVEEYVGYDPNTLLKPGYTSMIEFLKNKTKTKFQLNFTSFLEANENLGAFDTVLTSPPYWDAEIYTNEKGQSHLMGSTYEEWVKNFLEPYLSLSCDYLQENGHYILYIQDLRDIPAARDALKILENKLMHIETINVYQEEKERFTFPLFVFKK